MENDEKELNRTLYALGLSKLAKEEPDIIKNAIIDTFRYACGEKDFLTIQFLLKEGYVPFPKEELLEVYELIEAATSAQHLEIIHRIAAHTPKIEPLLYKTLLYGLEHNNGQMIWLAVKKGLNLKTYAPEIIDVFCSYNGNVNLFNNLIKYGLDIHQHHDRSFYRAVRNGYLEVVKVLLPAVKKPILNNFNMLTSIRENKTSTNETIKYLVEDYKNQSFIKKLSSPKRIFNKILTIGLSTITSLGSSKHNFVVSVYEELLKVSAESNNYELIDYLINIGANKKVVQWYGTEESKHYVNKIDLKDNLMIQLKKPNKEDEPIIKKCKI